MAAIVSWLRLFIKVLDLVASGVTVQTPRRIRPGLMGFVPQLILQSVVSG